ncbi:MAG: hypothetical protein AMJ69_07650, partial [Gammaproteobacteria bacterium SG8_47]
DVVAFRDINPQAPHHILVIPRKHVSTVNEFAATDAELIGKLVLAAKSIGTELGIAEDGYRLVLNCGRDAGQTVYHVHLHLIAGRSMHWPPG